MDLKKPQQSEETKRDEALARRLGGVLQQTSERDRVTCPDSGLLAAYVDRSLSADEIVQCEDHFASCSRCREIVTLLVASADPAAVEMPIAEPSQSAAGTAATADRIPRVLVLPSRTRWDWRARWLAPAVGVAAVLVIWFAVRPPWGGGSKDTLVAQAPRIEAPQLQVVPVPDQSSRTQAASGGAQQPAILSNRTNLPLAEKKQTANPSTKEQAKTRTPADTLTAANEVGADANADTLRDEKQKAGATVQAEQQSLQAAAPQAAEPTAPSAAPVPLSASAGRAITTADAPVSTSQSVVVTEAAPAIQAQAKARSGGIPSGTTFRSNQNPSSVDPYGGVFYVVQFAAPGTTIRWRAGSGGAIQRSSDSGRRWENQTSPSQQAWLAGAAVSDHVSWLVGRAGAIALTTDGERWISVRAPDVAGMPPDWVSVTVTDAQNATITSSDKRQFVTRDGGKTWQPQ